METNNDRRDERPVDISSVDSPKNTTEASLGNSEGSLTNDESAETDPNEVPDKASFKRTDNRNIEDSGTFDGTIGI